MRIYCKTCKECTELSSTGYHKGVFTYECKECGKNMTMEHLEVIELLAQSRVEWMDVPFAYIT